MSKTIMVILAFLYYFEIVKNSIDFARVAFRKQLSASTVLRLLFTNYKKED